MCILATAIQTAVGAFYTSFWEFCARWFSSSLFSGAWRTFAWAGVRDDGHPSSPQTITNSSKTRTTCPLVSESFKGFCSLILLNYKIFCCIFRCGKKGKYLRQRHGFRCGVRDAREKRVQICRRRQKRPQNEKRLRQTWTKS